MFKILIYSVVLQNSSPGLFGFKLLLAVLLCQQAHQRDW